MDDLQRYGLSVAAEVTARRSRCNSSFSESLLLAGFTKERISFACAIG